MARAVGNRFGYRNIQADRRILEWRRSTKPKLVLWTLGYESDRKEALVYELQSQGDVGIRVSIAGRRLGYESLSQGTCFGLRRFNSQVVLKV